MLPEPIAVTLRVAYILETLNIPYLVGGSIASTMYGIVRTTQDVDLVAELHAEHIKPLLQMLDPAFYIDAEAVAEAVRRRSSFNLIHNVADLLEKALNTL
jgi:hypothetical protein